MSNRLEHPQGQLDPGNGEASEKMNKGKPPSLGSPQSPA